VRVVRSESRDGLMAINISENTPYK
jgi:hypothetical protein